MTNQQISDRLCSLATTEYKKFNERIAASASFVLGVRVPHLRTFAKEIAKTQSNYLDNAEFDSYEKIMLYGLVLANTKLPLENFFIYFDSLVKRFDSWAHIDIILAELKAFKYDRDKVLEHFMPLKDSDGEFEKRTFVVLLLYYFLTDDYVDKTIALVKTVRAGQYYTDMAVAWLVSVGLVNYYDKFVCLLTDKTFSVFVHNKAISKAIDSFRIQKEQKEFFKTLKR